MSWMTSPVKTWRQARFIRRRRIERLPGIRATLRAAPNGYVALVGDSHAEFLGTPDFGDRSCINLGVGGSTAADCARHLASLHSDARATAAVLFIGTNNILRWRHPARPAAADRFTDDVDRILQTLAAWAERIFVAAVPPIGPWTTGRDPAAVMAFTERLRTLTEQGGFTFFDPFAGIRDGETGFALAGLHHDGFHMADYPAWPGRWFGWSAFASRLLRCRRSGPPRP
ncbi:SGNH/GDSL hydrolase family protein [Methylobacterium sp. J-026]|uniref:SGNH/GDSL hydrolase family protein n=1 Tax=Methylobacterium sp. J-026 TaxID=2836624 RepID=UPI001FB8A36D|nr:SGNH/GDSL hydrolase family protein [Methylobacterium sp. J-026]MCJ2136915.1 SGNH/GDSL hydrolase family protein [Methylobacterium sp. J-026]